MIDLIGFLLNWELLVINDPYAKKHRKLTQFLVWELQSMVLWQKKKMLHLLAKPNAA